MEWSNQTGDATRDSLSLQTVKEKLTYRICRMLLPLVIRVDGGIHAYSCRNIENDPNLFLGNIMDQGLLTAYQKLGDVIKNWRQGRFPIVCKTCDMYHYPCDRIVDYIVRKIHGFFKDFVGGTGPWKSQKE